jgi:hypothetical protein
MDEKAKTSGFAGMERQKQREIARKGGMAAHQLGKAHEFTSEEARNAGRKGGQRVSSNRAHMIEIGRLGGQRSAEARRVVRRSVESGPKSSPSGGDEGSTSPQPAMFTVDTDKTAPE